MCPCEKTAVLSRWAVQRRSSWWPSAAVTLEPVSTMRSPSSVVKAVQLANVGQNATPSVISASPGV